MVRERHAPSELRRTVRAVEQAPVPADRAFELAFPRLIEGLDHVGAEALALGNGQHVLDHARLVDRRRLGPVAHASGTRPADLAEHNVLPGTGRGPQAAGPRG